jgi:hypothetical protein
MSHRVAIAKRLTHGNDASARRSHKPFIMNSFHQTASGKPHQHLLKLKFGKASHIQDVPESKRSVFFDTPIGQPVCLQAIRPPAPRRHETGLFARW